MNAVIGYNQQTQTAFRLAGTCRRFLFLQHPTEELLEKLKHKGGDSV